MSEKNIINITQSGSTTLPDPVEGTTFTSVYVDANGSVTITMPLLANLAAGQSWLIKDVSGLAGTNNIAINANTGYTIDGASALTISTNNGYVTLEWDGANMVVAT